MSGSLMSATADRFDMPPRWDGLKVKWTDWTEQGHLTHYASPCDECGSTRPPQSCRGTVTASARHLPRFRSPNPELRRLQGAQIDAAPLKHLTATRCPDCGHTEVLDIFASQCWTLGREDYGPEGSRPQGPVVEVEQ